MEANKLKINFFHFKFYNVALALINNQIFTLNIYKNTYIQ